jgi:hypothetical protein
MKLSDALSMVTNGAAQKTASAVAPAPTNAPAPSGDVTERLKVALAEAMKPEEPKTASATTPSPLADLTKMAADLSASEHEAMKKEAMLYGAALCDGFMARAAQYQAAADKVASVAPTSTATKTAAEQDFEKFAAENPQLVKDAAQLGYDTAMQQLGQLHDAAYNKGWNDTVQQIHKTASDCFVAGFKVVVDMIEAAR